MLTFIAVVSCVFFEWMIQKYILKITPSISDGSAIITGILLAFRLLSNLPWWIVIIGALVAIGLGKMVYGGLGNNLFNPALVGRVFLLISFPQQMTTWPKPHLWFSQPRPFPMQPQSYSPGNNQKRLAQGRCITNLWKHYYLCQMLLGERGGSWVSGSLAIIAVYPLC